MPSLSLGHGHGHGLSLDTLEVPSPATGATPAERSRLWWRNVLVNSIFVVAWFTFSALLLLYNKAIVAKDYFAFPYPLFGTTVQMPIQFALAAAFRYARPQTFKPARNPSRRDYFTKVLPTAAATGLDIGLGNLSLKLITVSLYTMVKSASLIFVLGFAFLFKLEKYSLRLVLVIGLITLGVFLMTFQTTSSVAWGGIALVLTASLLAGFRWSCTQLLLRKEEVGLDNPAATIFWLAPLMGFTIALVSLGVDNWSVVLHDETFFGTPARVGKTLLMLGLPGIVAFLMVMSEFYLLQRTGIVTTSIVGIFKEVATISLGAWVFGDEVTPVKITGLAVTVSGIALYTWHKYRKTVEGSRVEEEGYALVREEEAFALGDDEEEEEVRHRKHRDSADGDMGRRSTGSEDADGDSLLDRGEGDDDARSVRTVNTVGTVGSTARKWRDR
ncbi:TPT-domain-containing protein [Exidia glandulosa HHB12029]|uniref:TPT-domain-containing protein n=1 Tax=Exidia glandulosa HHB12029 TaxID=1314781 RepID=A0A165I370_EXIGL|nr:TPT-domain-containing protein [Exidia glandulosa HHB12029]